MDHPREEILYRQLARCRQELKAKNEPSRGANSFRKLVLRVTDELTSSLSSVKGEEPSRQVPLPPERHLGSGAIEL